MPKIASECTRMASEILVLGCTMLPTTRHYNAGISELLLWLTSAGGRDHSRFGGNKSSRQSCRMSSR